MAGTPDYTPYPAKVDNVDRYKAADINVLNTALGWDTAGIVNVLGPSGAKGAGVTDDGAALGAADGSNAGNAVTRLPGVSAHYRLGTNRTLAHATRFDPGAVVKPDSGVTLTLNGPVIAGPWQIFDTSAGGAVALGPGAAPDGVRWEWFGSDATALQAAITAAEGTGQGQARVVCQPGKSYSIASGVMLKRSTILDLRGATITYTATTGVPFTQSTATDTGWQVGGIRDGKIAGSGGTATGAQIGSGTNAAQGIVYERVEITGFQDGVLVTATSGQAFLDNLRSCAIHNNSRDGVRINCNANEQLMLRDCAIFNNTNAGVHNVGGSTATVYQSGGSLDFNGTNVLNDATGVLEYHGQGIHFESSNTPHLSSTQTTLGSFVAILENCQLAQDATLTAAMVAVTSGIVRFLACNFALSGFSASPVALGDAGNHAVDATFLGNRFTSTGSAAVNWVNKVTTAGSTLVILGNGAQTGSTLAIYGGNVGGGDTVITDCGDATYGTLRAPAVATPSVAINGGRAWTVAPIGTASNVAYGTVAANSTTDVTVSVPGAAVGNRVSVVPNAAWAAGVTAPVGWVSASGTVTIRVANVTASGVAVGTVSTTIYVDG